MILEKIQKLEKEVETLKAEIARFKADKEHLGMVELFPNTNVYIQEELLESIIFNRLVVG